MEPSTFAELEHDSKKRRTRREVFLEKMDALIPWDRLEARIEPLYPKAGRGRRPAPFGERDSEFPLGVVLDDGPEPVARRMAPEMLEMERAADGWMLRAGAAVGIDCRGTATYQEGGKEGHEEAPR